MAAPGGILQIVLIYLIANVGIYTPSIAAQPQDLRIVTEILDPFQVVKDDKVTGIAVEHIRSIFHTAQLSMPDVEGHPWSRAFKIAEERPNTLIFGIVRTPEREQKFEWVGKFAQTTFYLFGLKSRAHIQINTLEDVKNYAIALRRGDVTYHYFKRNGFVENENLLLVFERSVVERLFFNGKLDVIVSSPFLMREQAKVFGVDESLYEPKFRLPELDVSFYLAAHPQTDPQLIETLRQHWPTEHLQY